MDERTGQTAGQTDQPANDSGSDGRVGVQQPHQLFFTIPHTPRTTRERASRPRAMHNWELDQLDVYRPIYKKFRARACEDKKSVTLTPRGWFEIVTSPCVLCGGFSLKSLSHKSDFRIVCNSVDRINSSLRIYSSDNSQSLCLPCNLSKREMTDEEYIDHATRVIHYQKHHRTPISPRARIGVHIVRARGSHISVGGIS